MSSTNERIGVGVIGLRNQGRLDGLDFLNSGEVDIVAVCDVDEAQIERVAKDFEDHPNQNHAPKRYKDFRDLIEDADVDGGIVHYNIAPPPDPVAYCPDVGVFKVRTLATEVALPNIAARMASFSELP